VALGHVVSAGGAPPPIAAVRCVRREVVAAAALGMAVQVDNFTTRVETA
jgi:hypothetical protein